MSGERAARERADPAHAEFRLANSPFYLLAQANGLYTLLMERRLKAVGMDLPRWRVLMVLHEQSPSTISEISRRAVMKLSTMTKVAQRLEKEGYVELRPNPDDRRTTHVHLCAPGREAVGTIRAVASDVFARALHDFTDDDVVRLTGLLERLGENLNRGG